jgi:hypothetical protein
VIWPKMNRHRKAMVALVFFGPGTAAWLPYLTGGHHKLWLALLLHVGVFSLACLMYFFSWRSDDQTLGLIDSIRKLPQWNVWLTVDGKRELLGTVRGTEDGARRFGQEQLITRCWNSELGIVVGTVEVEVLQ